MSLTPALMRILWQPMADSMRTIAHPARHRLILKRTRTTGLIPPCRRFCSSSSAREAVTPESATDESSKSDTGIKTPKGQKLGAWTPELDEMIGRLRSQHQTWEYISAAIGRPLSACSDRFYTTIDPELKNWTPAMFSRLDQMVEDGVRWPDIAAALNKKIITCRHQWATLGKGKYRVKGFLSSSTALNWKQHEIDGFWRAWLKYGRMDWKAIATHVGSRSERDCRGSFRAIVVHSLGDAPGWIKLEVFSYITETSRKARSRILLHLKDGECTSSAPNQTSSKWTPDEHTALLEAVEKHGLFSDWSVIRKQVKPNLSEDEVEAEYYRLNGVTMKADPKRQLAKPDVKPHDGWTEEEIQRLSTMLMKYSSLPVWTEEATEHGVEPSEDDYESLFQGPRRSSVKSKSGETADKTISISQPPKNQIESPWTKERIHRLRRLVTQQQVQERATNSPINWSWIADHIGPGIDESMCITMWHSTPESSKVKYVPAKFWSEKDMELLAQGISAYGKGWSLIQQNFLKERTTDSIRRKVTNLQKSRDVLVAAQREIALNQKRQNPDLDVDAFIQNNLKDNPQYSSIAYLEDLMQQYSEANGKVR
ncbi:hypothetical protein BGX26_010093 [Mortierella sp. AD094]|nr:hypothetical protein BGX26_010093 [Mortierella sp. AD094]